MLKELESEFYCPVACSLNFDIPMFCLRILITSFQYEFALGFFANVL